MKVFFIQISVSIFRFLYWPIKLFPVKDKITLISRQSDAMTLDFSIIMERMAVDAPQVEMIALTKRIKEPMVFHLGYGLHMLRQMYHMATSRVVILDGYCIAASILKHKKQTTIIQAWHALGAIKKFGYQTVGKPSGYSAAVSKVMCMHKNYDYVLCSAKATAGFFCQAFQVKQSQICYLGLPRIDFFLKNQDTLSERIHHSYPLLKEKQIILYAPTFRRGQGVCLRQLVDNLDFNKYNLIVKLHPLDRKATDCIPKEGILFDHRYKSYEWLIVCDKIITDYSALAMEASLLKKPLYFYLYDWKDYKIDPGLNVDLWSEAIGKYAFEEVFGLIEAFEKAYDYECLDAFREKYMGLASSDNGSRVALFIRRLLNENNQESN